MSGISLDELQFDPSDISGSQRVGSYLISAGGTLITDTAGALDVNVGNTVTVSATDLDIRSLTNATDYVGIGDESNLVDLEISDAAFAAGYGFSIYGVRQDAGGSPVSADGDAHPLVFNDDGELKVAADLTSSVGDDDADSGNPIKVGQRGVTTASAIGALSASNDRADLLSDLYRRLMVRDSHDVAWQLSAYTPAATAAELVGTPLGGRKRVLVQNLDNQPIYVGSANTVTVSGATGGHKIPKNASAEFLLGEALDIYMIAGGAGSANSVVVSEYA